MNIQALQAIFDAANSPTIKKLMEDRTKAEEALEKAELHLKEVEEKLAASLSPELRKVAEDVPATPASGSKRTRKASLRGPATTVSLQDLKMILADEPKKTLNIRKENYDTPNIKELARLNPTVLKYTPGAWPTVTLVGGK